MVVDKKNKLIAPILISVFLVTIYLLLGTKFLLAALIGVAGLLLSMKDLRIAIFSLTFIMPFMPNSLALGSYAGIVIIYFLRRIFIENSDTDRNIFLALIFLYFCVIAIGTFTSVDIKGSLRDFGLHLVGIMYLFSVLNSINTKEDLHRYVVTLMMSVTLVALIGLLQVVIGVDVEREWVDKSANPDLQTRVYSVFGNPNTLAEYLVFFTPIGVALFWETKDIKKKFIYGLSVGAMLLAIVLTMSRGGWIGIMVAALVFCILVEKRLLLLAIPIGIVMLFVLPQSVINRLLSIGNFNDTSNAHRFNIWQVTWNLIRDNKIAGVGFGYIPFKEVYETYSTTLNAYHSHNIYLQTIAELGLFGFIIFMSMMATFIGYTKSALINQKFMHTQDRYFKLLGAGIIAGMMGVFMHGFVENILYLPKVIFSFWTVITISVTAMKIIRLNAPRYIKSDDQLYRIEKKGARL